MNEGRSEKLCVLLFTTLTPLDATVRVVGWWSAMTHHTSALKDESNVIEKGWR